jgi:hypothetical protein
VDVAGPEGGEAVLGVLRAASVPVGGAQRAAAAEPRLASLRVRWVTRWRLASPGGEVRGGRDLAEPGRPCVRLVILCGPCLDRSGAERKLGVFGMDTHKQADRSVWVQPFRVPGNGPQLGFSSAVPLVRGRGASARVNLICAVKAGRGGKSGGGCRHTPGVPVAWITGQLGGMWAPGRRAVRKVPR